MRLKEPKVLEYVNDRFPFVTEIRFEDVPERCVEIEAYKALRGEESDEE